MQCVINAVLSMLQCVYSTSSKLFSAPYFPSIHLFSVFFYPSIAHCTINVQFELHSNGSRNKQQFVIRCNLSKTDLNHITDTRAAFQSQNTSQTQEHIILQRTAMPIQTEHQ